MNKIRKIACVILIILMAITTSTISQALDVYREDAQGIIIDHHFYPNTQLPGGTWFCIGPGAEFHVQELMTQGENARYPAGYLIPETGAYLCEDPECFPNLENELPWDNYVKYFYRYQAGQTFSFYEYPDAAYVLAEMTERGSLISWETAYGIWNSRVSNPKRVGDYQIVGESQAYKTFYETIHGGLTPNDIFEQLIKTDTSNIKVGVNQDEGSYTIGPIPLDYPDGVYDGQNKFSWIDDIQAITDAGNLKVEILLGNRQSISLDELKEKGTKTLDGKEFYVKFYTRDALTATIQVDFGYVEHCDAQMTEYTGTRVYRNWVRQVNGKHQHTRKVWDGWHDGDVNGDGIVDPGEGWNQYHDEHYGVDRRRYMAVDETGSTSQPLMLLSGTASKVRKKVTKYFTVGLPPQDTPPKPGIDLTMKLGGTVFLDEDTGKINEGNNKLDNGEGLSGVEVYLHEVGGGVVASTLTDGSGNYLFEKLNSQKKYYVEYVYNGMLYTNVERLAGNADDISKATEEAQGHSGNRQRFNDVFKEIGSWPENYKSPSRGAYNQVFLQEDIADTFKTIANNFGSHGNSDKEVYAYDNRIHAYSTEVYPLINIFTPDYSWNNIAGQNYNPIYSGAYNQLHVNLGIKARPTFDLALYKDVFNATLNINGQKEVYTYDARKDWQNQGFSYGVNEDYYLNELRNKYLAGKDPNIQTKETVNEGEYSHEYRTEEIINGNNMNENYQSWLQEDPNYLNTLYGSDSNKQYAWREINHQVKPEDRLQIHVTYKIAIRNQSSVVGSVTEVVDYYDGHYQFENAYVGDKNGNEIAGTKVDASESSMYGEGTRMGANGSWTVGSEKRGYKTIYLRPTEKKLYTDDKEQYIYVTFGLIEPELTLINAGLPQGKTFYTYNLAEINGYKTYGTNINDNNSMGLVDRDSNPGNFNPGTYEMGVTPLEDDTSKAPAYAYSIRTSRTLEGNVFEDANTGKASKDEYEVKVNTTRFGNGTIDDVKLDKRIKDVKVELVEIKDGKLITRQETRTDENGWYGFGAFLPGNYTIRFTYGADDKTALTKTSQYSQGSNETSYNGQDYQSTTFATKQGETVGAHLYKVDTALQDVYNNNNKAKNKEENNVLVEDQRITKYESDNYYWFDDASIANRSDATDDNARRNQVNSYAKSEYGRAITNHKAEVFNSYINQATLREQESKNKNFNEFTQAQPMDGDKAIDNKETNRALVNELERRTYMYAYTPEINVEVEYTTKQIGGNLNQTKPQGDKDYYEYKIVGVDFGVVERPRAQLTIDQDIKHVKVLASDGTTLLELNNNNGKVEVVVDNGNNYQWLKTGKFGEYDQDELINIILDDELLSGAKLEVTYNITVTNNSEVDTSSNHQTDNKTRAVNIINYVANNLNFDLADNNGLWEVVKKEDIQTSSHATWINNGVRANNTKLVDLSTQTTVLKATKENPLTKELKPGESTESTLTLKKTLSAESSADDLSYANLTEIVEIDNVVGRYDHGAIPGNQSLEEQPREHDTSGASRYDEIDQDAGTDKVKERYPQDGKIIVTPPTGSTQIYYILGTVATVILLVGVALIKKFVIDKRK